MLFVFIGLLVGINSALAASINGQIGYGPIIYGNAYRTTGFDYEPSAIWAPQWGQLQVWTCGLSENATDTIFLTIFNTYHPTSAALNTVGGPVQVLSNTAGSWDSASACSPSVLYLSDSEYRMYYECGTTLYHPNICFATSLDGWNWSKKGSLISNPFPPVTVDDGRYGIGHPSAVLDRDDPNNRTIRLYFWDSTWGVVRCDLMTADGSVFTGRGFPTNLTFPAKVKYYDWTYNGTGQSYFVATAASYNLNPAYSPGWFGTFISTDGIHFSPSGALHIPVPNGYTAQDAGQLVADGRGWIQFSRLDLEALIGAGQPPPYNQTWGIYAIQFSLNLP